MGFTFALESEGKVFLPQPNNAPDRLWCLLRIILTQEKAELIWINRQPPQILATNL
jgi:hypothetical protein